LFWKKRIFLSDLALTRLAVTLATQPFSNSILQLAISTASHKTGKPLTLIDLTSELTSVKILSNHESLNLKPHLHLHHMG
jgi:hypothetical protein